jgi:hypothetical protein
MKALHEVYAKKSKKFISITESVFHWNRSGRTYSNFKNFSKGLTSNQLIKFAKKHLKDRFILVQENSPTVPFPRRNTDAKEELTTFEDKIKSTKKYKETKKKWDEAMRKKYYVQPTKHNKSRKSIKPETYNPQYNINWIIFIVILILLILRAILN